MLNETLRQILRGIWLRFGFRPSTTRLRRNSAHIVAAFLRGVPTESLAGALWLDRDLIDDAIRWHMRKPVKKQRAALKRAGVRV